jgi:hypothetical protein
MKNFIFNILIEISFLALLAVIYYFYQKKRIINYRPEFNLTEELISFQNFIKLRISETDYDQDLINFNLNLIEELKNPTKDSILIILKNYLPKIKDAEVLTAIAEFENIINEN